MKPQPTGFNEMAASFQTSSSSRPQGRRAEKKATVNKIPNIRLSFITATDQAKFETLFKSAVGDNSTTMSGEKARDLLMRSQLDGDSLSHIWTLADTTRAGQLYFPEFALAMYLCNLKINRKSLPPTLPDNIKNEVSSMVDIISFSVVDDTPDTRSSNATPPAIQHPQPQPQASNAQLLQAQMTGFPGRPAHLFPPSLLASWTASWPRSSAPSYWLSYAECPGHWIPGTTTTDAPDAHRLQPACSAT
uniref:EH domain-containing protein n=1 Tax=Bionectria ochroleuca TaxID=29856 RepID=A0A8H7NAD5_BIOOC